MIQKAYTDDTRRVKALVGGYFFTQQIRISGSDQIDVPLLWPKGIYNRVMIKTHAKNHLKIPVSLLNHFEQHDGCQINIIGFNLV